MGMSEGGRERENTGNTSSQERVATEKVGSEETGSEQSEGPTMSTDCASPIGRSSHSLCDLEFQLILHVGPYS